MRNLALLVLLSVGVSGCTTMTRPEHAVVREGMDQATRSIRAEHKTWSKEKLDAGTMSQASYDNRLATHAEYEKLVTDDRNKDGAQ